MKEFTYRSLDEKENLEAILQRRKRKLNRQQLFFGGLFAAILLVLLLYIGRKVIYTDFDGYMYTDVNRLRAPYNMYVDSIYVVPGMILERGDTLFSYHVLEWLVMEVNPNDEPAVRARYRALTLQHTSTEQKMEVLETKIAELKKQIETNAHNIRFGLSDNAQQQNLERELIESEAEKKGLKKELFVLEAMMREIGIENAKKPAGKGALNIYESPGSNKTRLTKRYTLVDQAAVVLDVHAPNHMVFFEKEPIISFQHLDLKGNNLSVLAYIPIDKIGRLDNNMPAEVIVNRQLSFNAHVTIKAVRTEEVPEHLKSVFTTQSAVLMAILKIDPGQVIPFWCTTSGLPVKVRIKNFQSKRRNTEEEMQYEVGRGVFLDTIKATIL